MEQQASLFERFGGIRPMAKKLGIGKGIVDRWRAKRRVGDDYQDLVLLRARELGIQVAAEDLIWPFPEDRVAQ